MENLGQGTADALVARVERRVVADEPEQLGRLLADVLHREGELAGPAWAFALLLAERVAGRVDPLQRRLEQ